MLAPQTRRIYQLPSFTNPVTQLSGAYTVWEVPMGPVAGGYRTMRGTPEDLAAYLGLGAAPFQRLGLPGARILLAGVAPAPVVDGGVLYAIEDSGWNGGPGATVYVHGLDSGQFAPVGYGPVGGKMVLVSVDVVGGKYTELVPPGQIWYYVGDPAQQSISIGELDLASNAFDPNGLNEGNIFYSGATVNDNTVGSGFSLNKIGLDFRRNQIGYNCFDCDFQFSFTDNEIGDNVSACYFDSGTQYVAVGDNCQRVRLYNCAGTPQQPFVIPAGTTDAEYRNNQLVTSGGGAAVPATTDDLPEGLGDNRYFTPQRAAAKANEDDRFANLNIFDPAVPASAIVSLVNWNYEVAPAGSTWTLKPGKSVLLTAGRALLIDQSAREGDMFGVYIDPAAAANGIVLTSAGRIDGQTDKRYFGGTSLEFRYTLFPAYTDANGNQVPARLGLRTMQQFSPTAASILTPTPTRTADYTLTLLDAGCMVPVNSANAVAITVPTNSAVPFPNGTTLYVAQDGIGPVTIAPASGVVVQTADGYKVGGQWQDVALHKRDLNTWVLKGGVS